MTGSPSGVFSTTPPQDRIDPEVGGAGQELGEPAREVSHERGVGMIGRGHVGNVDPLVRPAAVHEVAPQGLPAVEAIARHPAVPHEGRGSVAIISTLAGARGSEMPSMSAKSPVCGPAATITVSAPNEPRVVSTAVTRPPRRVSPVTVVCWRIRPPWSWSAHAYACTVRWGLAWPPKWR